MKYTHHNNELTVKNLDELVYLKGWVAKVRNLGGLLFIDLRDKFGITQLIVNPNSEIYNKALEVKNEYVIEVKGKVIKRSSINKNIKTGEIEIDVSNLNILSKSLTPPLLIQDDTDALEEVRLKYRYLDLRRPVMQNYLIKRSNIMQSIRASLLNEGYLELETPMLGKSTPEGARDYLVPSRLYHNNFYALPQSPQIYKQLYMIAGFEKYFQFAKCFRDEDLRADRQPEFTQVDIEASFINEEDIKLLIEKMFVKLFKDVLNKDLETPFINMTYDEAVNIYGTDKPDLRFDLKLNDYTTYFKTLNIPLFENSEVVKGILVSGNFSRKVIDSYNELVKKYKARALAFLKYDNNAFSGSLSKFVNDNDFLKMENGDVLFLIGGELDIVNTSLGALRNKLGSDLSLASDDDFKFLWVTDWPLLEYDEEDERFYAKHHPFTEPKDVDELVNNPKNALAKAYDIVLNGYEIGGGSIRIYNEDVQNLMFKTLGFNDQDIKEKFGFFVEALKYGTPPHGGIALGLDRIVMLITKTKNIKDVIAFPKTQSAKDLMMEAPNLVDDLQLEELGLKLKK